MKRTTTLIFVTIGLSLITIHATRENSSTAEAKNTLGRHEPFKVEVSVSSDKRESALEGYMNGELRKLQGVEIDNANPP